MSKLEEATQVHAIVKIDGKKSTRHSFVKVALAFDRRIGEIITHERGFLLGSCRDVKF